MRVWNIHGLLVGDDLDPALDLLGVSICLVCHTADALTSGILAVFKKCGDLKGGCGEGAQLLARGDSGGRGSGGWRDLMVGGAGQVGGTAAAPAWRNN